jgi:hypothetical protein
MHAHIARLRRMSAGAGLRRMSAGAGCRRPGGRIGRMVRVNR